MKNLFVLIAVFIGLAVLTLSSAFIASLFIEGALVIALYALSGASFLVAVVVAVIGFIKSVKK